MRWAGLSEKMATEIPYTPMMTYGMPYKASLPIITPPERLSVMRSWLSNPELYGEYLIYRVHGTRLDDGVAYDHRVFGFNDYNTAHAFRSFFNADQPWY